MVGLSRKKATVEPVIQATESDLRKSIDVVLYEIMKDDKGVNMSPSRHLSIYKSLPVLGVDLNADSPGILRSDDDCMMTQQLNHVAKTPKVVKAVSRKKIHQASSTAVRLLDSNSGTATLTPEMEADLEILKMRHVLDPKRHYKTVLRNPPKLFQMARIVKTPKGLFSSQFRKSDRMSVEDFLVDTKFRKYCTKKFMEIQHLRRRHKKKNMRRFGKV
ncbi:rRNA-processing protein fcf2 [Trichoplax sp. H2]|nr:rRNA-processing protein fcf2 [Trichoplax sp. H2]|eukprot:RDD44366.1 rRNA-processing protein fcf2 [Trichoplax sp. H2]